MEKIKLVVTEYCPACAQTKALLDSEGLEYEIICNVFHDPNHKDKIRALCAEYNALVPDHEKADPEKLTSAPIMVVGNRMYTAFDCPIAVRDREWEE